MDVNIKRVLTSGFVAGIISSISALTMIPVVGNEMDAVLAARGLPPLSPAAMVYFCFLSLVFGVILMFLYALLKPRLGSGMRTAVMAAFIVWLLAYLIGNTSLAVYGFMPVRLVAIGTVWGLFELLLGSVAGAKLYDRKPKRCGPEASE